LVSGIEARIYLPGKTPGISELLKYVQRNGRMNQVEERRVHIDSSKEQGEACLFSECNIKFCSLDKRRNKKTP
jgi:hypothetical protein